MKKIFFFILILAAIVLAGCTSSNTDNTATKEINELIKEEVLLIKSDTCGCCGLYSSYLKKQGIKVNEKNVIDVISIKSNYNIPVEMQSCHTTIIGDYFVEGHIPLEAVVKLLKEKPDIAGIAMPGMPSGSPGMPGSKSGKFEIYAVAKDGSYSRFMEL